jgi:hypothetical protein
MSQLYLLWNNHQSVKLFEKIAITKKCPDLTARTLMKKANSPKKLACTECGAPEEMNLGKGKWR